MEDTEPCDGDWKVETDKGAKVFRRDLYRYAREFFYNSDIRWADMYVFKGAGWGMWVHMKSRGYKL